MEEIKIQIECLESDMQEYANYCIRDYQKKAGRLKEALDDYE